MCVSPSVCRFLLSCLVRFGFYIKVGNLQGNLQGILTGIWEAVIEQCMAFGGHAARQEPMPLLEYLRCSGMLQIQFETMAH